jgi:ubiquinone/menaquinone biosynthesis C-methylase UbiE
MNKNLELLLKDINMDEIDGVYRSFSLSPTYQDDEIKLRQKVASQQYDDYFKVIAQSHSIAVMDSEIEKILSQVPKDGLILDVGGCWGWHWRKLYKHRPDVGVVIVDLVFENFHHARDLLNHMIGKQVVLMHADAIDLPFPDADKTENPFNAVWTVQVFQHIPDYQRAVKESYRVLDRGGVFSTYSLHRTPLNKLINRLIGKRMHTDGMFNDMYFLNRASDSQLDIVSQVFGGNVIDRYTECLFHPDLKLGFTGKENSIIGRLDALFSGSVLCKWIARQRSFEVIKK